MKRQLLVTLLMCFSFHVFGAIDTSKFKHVCGSIYIKTKKIIFGINMTDNEKLFLCGSKTPGWSKIPDSQVRYHLKAFLRDRGYFQSAINYRNEKIYVDLGPQSKLNELEFKNAPKDFWRVSYKGALGKPLTSSLLEEVKVWSLGRLRALGYPCPKVEVEASYYYNRVVVKLLPGQRTYVKSIERPSDLGISVGALSRFDAIKPGDLYNGDYFSLTSRRLIASGLVNYSYFSNSCAKDEDISVVKQQVLTRQPQSVIFSVGASTEEFPITSIEWNHYKLDSSASTAQAQLYLSPLRQTLTTNLTLFSFDEFPRFYTNSSLEIERIDEDIYLAIYQRLRVSTGYLLDTAHHRFRFEIQPSYNNEKSIEGPSPDETRFLALQGEFRVSSHYYEFFQNSPRQGYQFGLKWQSQQRGLGSELTGNRMDVSGVYLHNIGNIDPPISVFGIRFQFSTVKSSDFDNVPQSYRLYLGGDRNLRGFSRNSINNKNLGYLTSSHIGLENRLVSWLPYNVEPLFLIDFGKVGKKPYTWEPLLFWSPGIGLRWQSPFGTFRGTASRGYIENENPQEIESLIKTGWVYYLSYGREF